MAGPSILAELVGVKPVTDFFRNAALAADGIAEEALSQIAAELARQVEINVTGPARWVKEPGPNGTYRRVNHPREGGPGVVTGNLRRSVIITGPRSLGNGSAEIAVGVNTVYARSLEHGNPRWKRHGGYPYFEPAVRAIVTEANVHAAYAAAWTRHASRLRAGL